MKLATEIVKFFFYENGMESVSPDKIKTFNDFIEQDHHFHSSDVNTIIHTLNKLKSEGIITSYGTPIIPDKPLLFSEILTTNSYNETLANYGSYDFIVEVFLSIVNHFKKSVFPVVVRKSDGDDDIGTAFLLGNINTLVTARHVIENVDLIKIPDLSGKPIQAHSILIPEDDRIDIAIIIEANNAYTGVPPFRSTNPEILDEVLTIGYPPLPGFDAMQLYEIATVNNSIKFSRGRVIGSSKSYLDYIEYVVINAKVKGGNSGSPVINRRGLIVGMVVQIPIDSKDASQIDKLGYGIVTPTSEIRNVLSGQNQIPLIEKKVTNLKNGFRIDNV